MKRALAILSFACYFAVTTGVIINSHYCMKKLASVRLFELESKTCGICGMDTHEFELTGCCRDEVKVIKLVQDQHQLIVANYDIPSIEAIIVAPSQFIIARLENSIGQRHFHNHSPPLLSAQDTYLQNNVFRI